MSPRQVLDLEGDLADEVLTYLHWFPALREIPFEQFQHLST